MPSLILLVSFSALAQVPVQTPPPESILRQIKKTVVYIIGNYQIEGVQRQSAATGFLIFLPEARLGNNRGYIWLVTCKRVLRQPTPEGPEGTQGPFFRNVLVRINTKLRVPGTTRQFDLVVAQVSDEAGKLSWFSDQTDDTVDLALTQVGVDEGVVEAKWIPSDILLTKQKLTEDGIDENVDLLFAGLFAWDPGALKNYPIIRHCKLARIPEECVPLVLGQPEPSEDVHPAEITSFGGNSGFPVFVRVGGVRESLSGSSISPYFV